MIPEAWLTDGKLVPRTKGVDGTGFADGFMTLEAAVVNGDINARALPGDGCFKGTAGHPEIRLNFTNADGKGWQTRSVAGKGGFSFPVPGRQYQRMMVFLTSAAGSSHRHFQLVYGDGTLEHRAVVLPDYYSAAPAGGTNIFSLTTDLAKWDAAGRMAERDHHYIHGVELHPDARRNLVSIQVLKKV